MTNLLLFGNDKNMHKNDIEKAELLRSLTAEQAASWLLENEPKNCKLINVRSWPVTQQVVLGKNYLKSIPHSSAICYEALLSIMSISTFLKAINQYLPLVSSDYALLKYYLFPSLDKFSRNSKDESLIKDFKITIDNNL